MDQGTFIRVRITVDKARREATIDFTGTSPQQPTNFNAPEPVARAAVLYVFRVMVDDDIPMNAGCLRPIHIAIPRRSMLSPEYPAAGDAVHTHMTNTRLTDPEVLEFRFPVVLEDFHIRAGSGGRGKWNAGDGVIRTIRFLERMECTILSGHRRVRPFGLAGGEPGELGENWVRRNDGRRERLNGADATVLDAGEAIIIQTPTAGGYGRPEDDAAGR
jgi:5-oxoprolinase (ATP-hydrolysing)